MNEDNEHKLESQLRDMLGKRDWKQLMHALCWTPHATSIPATGWRSWGWVHEAPPGEVICKSPGYRVVHIKGAVQRGLCCWVRRSAPLETVLWLFEGERELTIALALSTPDGSVRLRTMSIDLDEPDSMGLARLMMLHHDAVARPDDIDPAQALSRHVEEVLDHEALTRAFFVGLRSALVQLSGSSLRGPVNPDERWESALVVLLRLIFLYFLQREGLLDGDRRYVARRLRSAKTNLFDRVLRPLFFGVLNTPEQERDEVAARLGRVPFLNGGLFEPTVIERRHPTMSWPDHVLREIVESVFERFHFTAVEPSGADEATVVDPEMLGKVFEGLMIPDARRGSGAFYTPRDVVRGMMDAALDGYISDRADDGVPEDVALHTVRILDPAVGTGAFLLEALAALRERKEAATGVPADYATMRALVHDHLFGVDRNRAAVRLCELRVWLALLSALRRADGVVEPLPNLGHRLAAGDSLLAGVDIVDRRAGGLHPRSLVGIMQLEARHARLQRRFLDAHGLEKQRLRCELEELETSLQRALVDGRLHLIDERRRPLQSVEASRDLFGGSLSTAAQTRALADLDQRYAQLVSQRDAIESGRANAVGFAYESRFGAPARDGFDIVVTNPPWVRAQRLDRPQRAVLAHRYQTARHELWPGARELGIRAPYGAQPDLAALFVERSLQLLRPGGRLIALIPAKLLRGLHGAPMRRLLSDHCIEQVEDLADADRQLFDAVTYPAVLHVRKATPQQQRVDVRLWRGPRVHRFRQPIRSLPQAQASGSPWSLMPEEIRLIVERACESSARLGTIPSLRIRRGIFTGANDVFLRPVGGFRAEFGDRVQPFVREVVSGSSLGGPAQRELLWCYEDGAPLRQLPDFLLEYFSSNSHRLLCRADHDPRRPSWQLFRVQPEADVLRVAWRDMSALLEPHLLPTEAIALNTVYYATLDTAANTRGLCRWMQDPLVRTVAQSIAERARGGWRRHFAWVVRLLPVPMECAEEGFANFDEHSFDLTSGEREALSAWLGLTHPRQEVA